MAMIKVKGHEFAALTIRDSFDRRALQFKNKIIETLRRIGLTEDDVDIDLENAAVRNAPASVSWYFCDHHLYYSYKSAPKYVENLYVVFKVIELEVDALVSEEKSPEEFIHDFSEDTDVKKKRKEAREILGVDENDTDLKSIDTKYKELAKKHHPDMSDGDTEKFKQINHAHKILRRELQ
jgi:hypothetical protein